MCAAALACARDRIVDWWSRGYTKAPSCAGHPARPRAIAERRLQQARVERVVGEPEWSEASGRRAGVTLLFAWMAEAGNKVLRVVAVDEAGVRVVLSAHFDRKATQAARARDADDL